jgi:hypothetical protein
VRIEQAQGILVAALGVMAGHYVRIPMISTGYSDRSRPPVPTDRDHFG